MQLKSDVFPEPLGPITATVSPSEMERERPPSAVIPPKRSARSLTWRSWAAAMTGPLEVRGEVLIPRDLLHGGVLGLAGAHQPHRVLAVVPVGAEVHRSEQAAAGVALHRLHRLDELLAGQVAAGALQALDHHADVAHAGDAESLAALQLGIDL